MWISSVLYVTTKNPVFPGGSLQLHNVGKGQFLKRLLGQKVLAGRQKVKENHKYAQASLQAQT